MQKDCCSFRVMGYWLKNLPLLKTGGGEVAEGTKGPPVLVLWNGMVVVSSKTPVARNRKWRGCGGCKRPTGARFMGWEGGSACKPPVA